MNVLLRSVSAAAKLLPLSREVMRHSLAARQAWQKGVGLERELMKSREAQPWEGERGERRLPLTITVEGGTVVATRCPTPPLLLLEVLTWAVDPPGWVSPRLSTTFSVAGKGGSCRAWRFKGRILKPVLGSGARQDGHLTFCCLCWPLLSNGGSRMLSRRKD